MATSVNFDRQYRLIAGKAGGNGFEIGTPENGHPLHISFAFQKSDLTTQNTGRVSIWNLNKQHLSVIESKDCVVSLSAGYGTRISQIFTGVVTHAVTTIDNADRRTEVELVDNLIEVRDTYVAVSYNGVVNWKKIFDDVAGQMGVVISYAYNVEFASVSNGFSFVGQAKNILTKGCDCCGLTWSLQNGIIQIKRPGDTMSREVYLLSSDTGLIGIPARVSEAASGENKTSLLGWDVEYLLNGAINIDDYVKLESNIVTGYFRVYSLEISGDNVSGDWICRARLLEVD